MLRSLPLATLAALCTLVPLASVASAQALPESPAIWREVSGIENVAPVGWEPRFLRPHVPSFRTTLDGRVAVNVAGTPRVTLLKPEKLDGASEPLLHQPPGAYTISWDNESVPDAGYVGGSLLAARDVYANGTGRIPTHACLWDDAPPISNAQGQDVYELKVLVTTDTPTAPRSLQLFMTEVVVTVDQPKTASATIASVVQKPGTSTIAGPVYDASPSVTRQFTGSGFEPTIAGDGRLLVFRIASPDLPVGPAGSTTPQSVDIVYSYYQGGDTADPTRWVDVYPITHAYFDARINARFGFAKYRMQDPRGYAIPDWEDLGATYPWIDRAAKNVFFTTVRSMLHTAKSNWTAGRYALRELPGDPNVLYGSEDPGATRGVAFVGLWSRGKMVLLDNLNSNMDYGIGNEGAPAPPLYVGPQQRLVTLYADGGPNPQGARGAPGAPGEVQLGYGRASYGLALPKGENENNTILDSLQNHLNTKRAALPIAPRDVVWYLQNGSHTDQLVFDDYLDPDALIVASMAGLLRFPEDASGPQYNRLSYDDGWDEVQEEFGDPSAFPIRVQNASTAHHRWLLPGFGRLLHDGSGRLEPVAAGGVHGKGLWLEADMGLRFAVPFQASAPAALAGEDPSTKPAYVSLFVDCRFDDDGVDRLLLSFPSGARVFLRGRSAVVFDDGGQALHVSTLPSDFTHTTASLPSPYEFLPRRGWAHLALALRDGGREVTLLLNGLPLDRWTAAASFARVFGGAFVVGNPGGAYAGDAFRGWIDEVKVLLHDVDAETACNHANGTLLGVDASASATSWARRFAESFPAWAHAELDFALRARGEAAHGAYANFHDYSRDDGVYEAARPSDTTPLGEAIHFPEGPLFHDRPRPDSSTNRFCLSCHDSGEVFGLSLDALRYADGVNAPDDPRRQPMQPPPRIAGVIPAGLVDAGPVPLPTSTVELGTTTHAVDEWLLAARGGRASTVESVFVLAAGTGEPLLELDPSARTVVDLAALGATRITLQANLDAGQGSVAFELIERRTPAVRSLVDRRVAEHGPYTLFQTDAAPFRGRAFPVGVYSLRVTPVGGTDRWFAFEVR